MRQKIQHLLEAAITRLILRFCEMKIHMEAHHSYLVFVKYVLVALEIVKATAFGIASESQQNMENLV